MAAEPIILTLNCGSSSIKFGLYEIDEHQLLKRGCFGSIDRIGLSGTSFKANSRDGSSLKNCNLPDSSFKSAQTALIDFLEEAKFFNSIRAVGQRVAQGMEHSVPELLTASLMNELRFLAPLFPDHLPWEISLIEAIEERYKELPQVICFETAFHRTMPAVAKLLPIPRRYQLSGLQRYGFHGISYSYLMEELKKLPDNAALNGRVILAHLGSGSSMAAVLNGRSIDTSMGFTPTAGLVMGTRSGDLDPGIAPYLELTEQMTGKEFYEMVNHKSGLLGVSETSSDMLDLLEKESLDSRAAEAIALFCYQAKKWIGAFAAVLGGVDTLVFAGGIGENSPPVRQRICEGLSFLGIELDESSNKKNSSIISCVESRVAVRVIRTNEELMIARSVLHLLGKSFSSLVQSTVCSEV